MEEDELIKLSKLNDLNAMLELGKYYLSINEYELAKKWLIDCFINGNLDAFDYINDSIGSGFFDMSDEDYYLNIKKALLCGNYDEDNKVFNELLSFLRVKNLIREYEPFFIELIKKKIYKGDIEGVVVLREYVSDAEKRKVDKALELISKMMLYNKA